MIWSAAFDPEILPIAVRPAIGRDPDILSLRAIAPWLTIVTDACDAEHVLLSDGWHHIRLDIEEGRMSDQDAVRLEVRLRGLASSERMVLPLRRFLALCRQRRFSPALYPRDPRIERGIAMLRVHDALRQGASHRDIAAVLVGEDRAAREWAGASDSLRSRIRRLVRDARAMAHGGYRLLLKGR